jgi:propionyl-CoA carboxylase alpha chain
MQQRTFAGEHGSHIVDYSLSSPFDVDGVGTVWIVAATPGSVTLSVAGTEHVFEVARYDDLRYVDSRLGPARLEAVPRFLASDREEDAGSLHAPMPGKVIRVDAVGGASVSEGPTLVVMEAMKMELALSAPFDGVLARVEVAPGDQVPLGHVVFEVVADEA